MGEEKELGPVASLPEASPLMRYKTDRWSYEIKPVEIIRETAESVFLKETNPYRKTKERRESKASSYYAYHETELDALDHLISRAQNAMEAAKAETHRLNTALGQLESRKRKMTAELARPDERSESVPTPPSPVTPETPQGATP